jgi:hypothetical protein
LTSNEIGRNPEKYGIKLIQPRISRFGCFDDYAIPFEDPTGVDHEMLGKGLNRALNSFMMGEGIDHDVQSWFTEAVPRAQVSPTFVADTLVPDFKVISPGPVTMMGTAHRNGGENFPV